MAKLKIRRLHTEKRINYNDDDSNTLGLLVYWYGEGAMVFLTQHKKNFIPKTRQEFFLPYGQIFLACVVWTNFFLYHLLNKLLKNIAPPPPVIQWSALYGCWVRWKTRASNLKLNTTVNINEPNKERVKFNTANKVRRRVVRESWSS